MRKPALFFAGCACALAAATPGSAQIGTPTLSPPPEGVTQGEGAGYPKGRYAALEALPDWGGIWFVIAGGFEASAVRSGPKLKGDFLARREQWVAEVRANDGVERRTQSNADRPGPCLADGRSHREELEDAAVALSAVASDTGHA